MECHHPGLRERDEAETYTVGVAGAADQRIQETSS